MQKRFLQTIEELLKEYSEFRVKSTFILWTWRKATSSCGAFIVLFFLYRVKFLIKSFSSFFHNKFQLMMFQLPQSCSYCRNLYFFLPFSPPMRSINKNTSENMSKCKYCVQFSNAYHTYLWLMSWRHVLQMAMIFKSGVFSGFFLLLCPSKTINK